MNWMSLLGLEDTVARARSLMNEGAIAAEDRMDLLSIEWQETKKNIVWMLVMGLVVAGLTIVALTLLSGAIIITYWDTPSRLFVTWLVAGFWGLLWFGIVIFLWKTAKKATNPFQLTKSVLKTDWQAVKRRLK
ncbi:MAG: phage holin family protein [Comamonas sp.]